MNCFIVLARPAPKSSHNPAGGESGTATFCLGRSRWSLGGRTSIAGRGCPLCSGHLRAAATGRARTMKQFITSSGILSQRVFSPHRTCKDVRYCTATAIEPHVDGRLLSGRGPLPAATVSTAWRIAQNPRFVVEGQGHALGYPARYSLALSAPSPSRRHIISVMYWQRVQNGTARVPTREIYFGLDRRNFDPLAPSDWAGRHRPRRMAMRGNRKRLRRA